MKKLLVALTFIIGTLSAIAQDDSTKPSFKLSLNYNTNLNYYGRTDSLKSSGFFPMAELWFTPKFYINAAPIFVNNAVQSFEYAGTVATIGYQNVTDKWITSLYALKPFYKESSALVQSALKAQGGFNLSYLNPVLNLNGGADLKYSDQADFGVTAGVDHLIRIENADNSVLVIDPSAYLYAGTQKFTNTYYKRNNIGMGGIGIPGNGRTVTEEVQKFNVLAYELSVPVVYSKGKVMLIATPAYIIPQNLVTVQNRPDLSERGENTLYATLTAKYSF
jgi:hypothetical protein